MSRLRFRSLRELYRAGNDQPRPEIQPEPEVEAEAQPEAEVEVEAEPRGCSSEEKSGEESQVTAVTGEIPEGSNREETSGGQSVIDAPATVVSSGSKKEIFSSQLCNEKLVSEEDSRVIDACPAVALTGTKADGVSGCAPRATDSKRSSYSSEGRFRKARKTGHLLSACVSQESSVGNEESEGSLKTPSRGDEISGISGSDSMKVLADSGSERENVSCSVSMANSIVSEIENAINDRPSSNVTPLGNVGDKSADAAKCSDKIEQSGLLAEVVEEAEAGKTVIQSVPAVCVDGSGKQNEKTEKEVEAVKTLSSNEGKKSYLHLRAFRTKSTWQRKTSPPRSESPTGRPSEAQKKKSPPASGEAVSGRKRTVGNITRPPALLSHASKKLKSLPSSSPSQTAFKTPQPPISSGFKQPQSQASKGPLSKSNTFPSPISKQEVQNIVRETAEEGAAEPMLQTSSFNNAVLGGRRNTGVAPKAPPPKSPSGRVPKVKYLPFIETGKIPTSAVKNSSGIEKAVNVTALMKTSTVEPPRSNHQDLPAKKRYVRSNNASGSAIDLCKSSLLLEKNKGSVDEVKVSTTSTDCSNAVIPHEENPNLKDGILSATLRNTTPQTNKGSVDEGRVSTTSTDSSNAVVPHEENPNLKSGVLPSTLRNITPQTSGLLEPVHAWQGKFEFSGGDDLPIICSVLGHMSRLASSKVRDLVRELPQKLEVAEVPLNSFWPARSVGSYVKEEHIGLYFLAEDLESNQKSYMSLVNSLVKNDSCFKARFGEYELLVFASNLLSEEVQCWNKKFFLWGVFIGTKEKSPSTPSSSGSCLNSEPVGEVPPAPVRSSDSAPTNLIPSGENPQSEVNSTSSVDIPTVASPEMAEVDEAKVSSPEEKLLEDVPTISGGSPMKNEMPDSTCSVEMPNLASSEMDEVSETKVSSPGKKILEEVQTQSRQLDLLQTAMKTDMSNSSSSIDMPPLASGQLDEVKETEVSSPEQKALEEVPPESSAAEKTEPSADAPAAAESSERGQGEGSSRRGLGIDLNRPFEENEDNWNTEDGPFCKKQKQCTGGIVIEEPRSNSEGVVNSSHTFSPAVNCLRPSVPAGENLSNKGKQSIGAREEPRGFQPYNRLINRFSSAANSQIIPSAPADEHLNQRLKHPVTEMEGSGSLQGVNSSSHMVPFATNGHSPSVSREIVRIGGSGAFTAFNSENYLNRYNSMMQQQVPPRQNQLQAQMIPYFPVGIHNVAGSSVNSSEILPSRFSPFLHQVPWQHQVHGQMIPYNVAGSSVNFAENYPNRFSAYLPAWPIQVQGQLPYLPIGTHSMAGSFANLNTEAYPNNYSSVLQRQINEPNQLRLATYSGVPDAELSLGHTNQPRPDLTLTLEPPRAAPGAPASSSANSEPKMPLPWWRR